jgi:nitrite reductase (NADH) large subunit
VPDPACARVVVVGYGMVAHRFVEALTARDTDGRYDVTVIGEEPRRAYDRVAMTSYLSGVTADELTLPTQDGAGTLVIGDRALVVDRDARAVTTSAGRHIPYDELVLATGSNPFVPPVPGRELPGVFTYRTIEDLDRIRDWAGGRKTGVVVGGGLLGLEAAGALRSLELDTHVVEFAPRLMPMQVDEGGGAALRRRIETLGVQIHVGTGCERFEGDETAGVQTVRLGDGSEIAADVVVIAAGVRPRDDLARDAELRVGERGGVVVDERCHTADPAIWAIGECACIGGSVHGLVAPGYAMAEVLADRLLGGDATFVEADTSTKLKLLGVDVASFGDAFGQTENALDVVYNDPVTGTYKKLVVTDDARTLLGGMLVGEATAYPVLRALVGRPILDDPQALLLGGSVTAPGGSLPMDATVCSCHNVSKATVIDAVETAGCTDIPAVKACTKAGTGCGSCVPLLKTILAEAGVESSRALCEHFETSRAELFDIVQVTGITTFTELIARYGHGRGCDVCKPAVASILASLGGGHVLDGEQAALQGTNDHFLANLQKDGTYSVVPRIPGGEITPEKLIVIGEVARDYSLYTKITGGQRIDMFGARVEQLPAIWQRLVEAGFESGHAYGKALRTVKSCVGTTWCRYGVQDSVGLAVELELRYRGLRAPHKIKAGVSGCARECAEAQGKDFGVIATENGWNLYVGGNGGFRPRHAELFAADLDKLTLVRYIDRFLMYYIRTADRLQRTASWLESLDGGLEQLRRVIVDDELGIGAELDAQMLRHVEDYEDEWGAVLGDPDKLRRFVSFVNAPETPDPSIKFVTERGQPRPAGPVDLGTPTLEVVSS